LLASAKTLITGIGEQRLQKGYLPNRTCVVNRKDQRQLETLRRGQVDAAEHVATSQEAIEDSLTLLQRSDRMQAARKSETRRRYSEGLGADRAARRKTRPRRSGA
jgi:hypothetical protein